MKCHDEWCRCVNELGLPPDASWGQIQARYRQLVLAFHPDVNPSQSAAEHFRRVASAYESLHDLWRKRRYQSVEDLSEMRNDPKIRRLSPAELGLRLRFSSSANVRAAAACLLGLVDTKEARHYLLSTRKDPDDTVRCVAVEAIGKKGRLTDLLRFLPFLNRHLANAYLHALRHIAGRAVQRFIPRIQTCGKEKPVRYFV
jgi:curved DNA-binding protein CbpA